MGLREGNLACREDAVVENRIQQPVLHFVGSIPLPDAETVFRTLAETAGPYLRRLPDGKTGIRKTWIRFLQDVLAANPAIEPASAVPPFKFTQWDGKLIREITRLRVKPGARPDPVTFATDYADMASSRGACSTGYGRPGSFRRRSNFKSRCRRRSHRPTITWYPRTGRCCFRLSRST
jgi:hypothetical protein